MEWSDGHDDDDDEQPSKCSPLGVDLPPRGFYYFHPPDFPTLSFLLLFSSFSFLLFFFFSSFLFFFSFLLFVFSFILLFCGKTRFMDPNPKCEIESPCSTNRTVLLLLSMWGGGSWGGEVNGAVQGMEVGG